MAEFKKVIDIRKNLGLSQRAAAEMLHIPLRTWESWEIGKRTAPPYVTELILYRLKDELNKKTDRYFYPAVFTYEPGQEIAVDFPDLKCATSGINDDDAFLSARELLGCVIYGLEEDGAEIPSPTPLKNIETKSNERVVLIDVYISKGA